MKNPAQRSAFKPSAIASESAFELFMTQQYQ